MDADIDIVLFGIIAFIIVKNAMEIYLSMRQIKVYKTAAKIPQELDKIMTEETFHKARFYELDKEWFAIFKAIIKNVIILTIELYFGFIAYIWHESQILTEKLNLNPESEIQVSCFFLVVMNAIIFLKELPFSVYSTFGLEEKHGFNKQTYGFYIKDQIKAFITDQIVYVPTAAAIVFIAQKGGDQFFIWLWGFAAITLFLWLTIYPVFIAPLFDKYRSLEEGELRDSIERLAASIKFPLAKLYVVDGSKRSAHSNAYFYGLFGSKRIVLFDTLLINKGKEDDSELKEEEKGKGCTNDEVLAVLAHELGHWKLGHTTKHIIIMQINLFFMFGAFGYLFQYDLFYRALKFPQGTRPILAGLFIILSYVLTPYNVVISFAMKILSRKFEYQADDFANKLGYSEQLGRALVKVNVDNLGFPFYDWMYSAWNHSHPTLLQRLNRLQETKKNM